MKFLLILLFTQSLFATCLLEKIVLSGEIDDLQRFFESNPDYNIEKHDLLSKVSSKTKPEVLQKLFKCGLSPKVGNINPFFKYNVVQDNALRLVLLKNNVDSNLIYKRSDNPLWQYPPIAQFWMGHPTREYIKELNINFITLEMAMDFYHYGSSFDYLRRSYELRESLSFESKKKLELLWDEVILHNRELKKILFSNLIKDVLISDSLITNKIYSFLSWSDLVRLYDLSPLSWKSLGIPLTEEEINSRLSFNCPENYL